MPVICPVTDFFAIPRYGLSIPQKPKTPSKDVRLSFPKEGDVHLHGDLIINYHQTTIVELGGGNKSDQTTTQDISPKLEIPLVP